MPRGSPTYVTHMLKVYEAVIAVDGLNFSRARIWLPSNLHFKKWEALMESSVNVLMVHYLKFGFPTGHEGLVPTPATGNRSPLCAQTPAHVTVEVQGGAMVGPFDPLPFTPWC